MNDEPTIIKSLEEHLKEYGHTTVGQDIAAAILVIRELHAVNANAHSSYMIGPQTMERVFKAAGLVNMSDLQAVMDAVERALTSQGIKPLEWDRGDYISSAQSINSLAFTAQYIGDGDEGWALHTYLTNETKRTRHETREAAEQAAQALHNAELVKYLSG